MKGRAFFILLSSVFLYNCASSSIKTLDEKKQKEEKSAYVQEEQDVLPIERKVSVRFEDGTLDGYTLFDYAPNGNLLKTERFSASALLLEESIYQYKKGLLVEIERRDEKGRLQSKTIYAYSDKLLTYEGLEDSDGHILMSFHYAYDKEDRQVFRETYASDGKKLASTRYFWQDGILQKTEFFDAFERLLTYSNYAYGSEKNILRQDFYNASNNLIRSEISEYTDSLRTSLTRIDRKGNLLFIHRFEYGDFGELKRKIVDDKMAGSKYSYTYEYMFRKKEYTLAE